MKRFVSIMLVLVMVLGISIPCMAAEENKVISAPVTENVVKVACIGDSITDGIGVDDKTANSYPAQLSVMLGEGYDVKNFGLTRTAALKTAKWPYWDTEEYPQSLQFVPDLVVAMFGTNDIKTENWVDGKASFVSDYTALLNTYKAVNPDVKFIVMLPPPICIDENDPVRPPLNLVNEGIPLIKVMADANKADVIDLYTLFSANKELLGDGIHPTKEGYTLLTQTVADKINEIYAVPTWADNLANVEPFEDPAKEITREEFAYLIVSIFGLEGNDTVAKFEDIADCKYKEQIETAFANGVINGVDDTHFEPSGLITREEISAMLNRSWKVLFPTDSFAVENTYDFVDKADVSDWAMEAVTYLYDREIMLGTDTLTISPKVNIPREHALLLMSRIVEKYGK